MASRSREPHPLITAHCTRAVMHAQYFNCHLNSWPRDQITELALLPHDHEYSYIVIEYFHNENLMSQTVQYSRISLIWILLLIINYGDTQWLNKQQSTCWSLDVRDNSGSPCTTAADTWIAKSIFKYTHEQQTMKSVIHVHVQWNPAKAATIETRKFGRYRGVAKRAKPAR